MTKGSILTVIPFSKVTLTVAVVVTFVKTMRLLAVAFLCLSFPRIALLVARLIRAVISVVTTVVIVVTRTIRTMVAH